jgi:3-methyladenine DNA glycosylase Tag
MSFVGLWTLEGSAAVAWHPKPHIEAVIKDQQILASLSKIYSTFQTARPIKAARSGGTERYPSIVLLQPSDASNAKECAAARSSWARY